MKDTNDLKDQTDLISYLLFKTRNDRTAELYMGTASEGRDACVVV